MSRTTDELALLRELRAARAEHDRLMAGRAAEVTALDVPPGLTDEQRESMRRLMIAEDRWRDR